jgi:hypothetical protein
MKKAIIIGKGPSAKPIKKRSEFDIIALNNAVSLCEEVDYLFINDFEILDLISKRDWQKVKCLVLPIKPHFEMRPHPEKTYEDFLNQIPVVLSNVILHKLFPEQNVNNIEAPCYPIRYSVGTTAFQWMVENKYDYVEYCGIDREGGYDKKFIILDENNKPKNHACTPLNSNWYERNYDLIIFIADKGKIKLKKIG